MWFGGVSTRGSFSILPAPQAFSRIVYLLGDWRPRAGRRHAAQRLLEGPLAAYGGTPLAEHPGAVRRGERPVSARDVCVVILAGGAASRFGGVTQVLPKC